MKHIKYSKSFTKGAEPDCMLTCPACEQDRQNVLKRASESIWAGDVAFVQRWGNVDSTEACVVTKIDKVNRTITIKKV